MRAQLVVALVAVLILLAVPLYLWRRPSGTENAPDPSQQAPGALIPSSLPSAVPTPDSGRDRVTLAGVQRVRCSASARISGQKGALCDALPFFEENLEKAILQSVDCAPKTGKQGTVNYALTVDFTNKKVNVFPGASGSWRGPQARRSAECVERALPPPEWDKIRHQYRYYIMAIMATYEAPEPAKDPMFE